MACTIAEGNSTMDNKVFHFENEGATYPKDSQDKFPLLELGLLGISECLKCNMRIQINTKIK
jgi:hypothetical protein